MRRRIPQRFALQTNTLIYHHWFTLCLQCLMLWPAWEAHSEHENSLSPRLPLLLPLLPFPGGETAEVVVAKKHQNTHCTCFLYFDTLHITL